MVCERSGVRSKTGRQGTRRREAQQCGHRGWKDLRLVVDAIISEWNQKDHVGDKEADKGDCQCPSECNLILRSHIHTLVCINSV